MPDVDAVPLTSYRYQYDHDGVRVGREKWEYDAGTEEWTRVKIKRFLVDKLQPFAQVVAEYIDNAAEPTDIATDDILRLRYAHGDDLLTHTRIVQTTATTRYLHADGQLSTRQLTDTNADPAAVIEAGRYTYDAFGEDLSLAGESFDAGTGSTTAYRYTGEHYDNESGHYHLRARQYDPAVGRFNGRDPWTGENRIPQTMHAYAYTCADPVNRRDPSGMMSITESLTVSGIQAILFTINAYTFYQNTVRGIEATAAAVGYMRNGELWDAVISVAIAAIHFGCAALSLFGMFMSLRPPPAMVAGQLALAGPHGLQYAWTLVAMNPRFAVWIAEIVAPAVLGSLALFQSRPHHHADWELRDSRGRIKTRGHAVSGGTGGRLSWADQLRTHTERKILELLRRFGVEPGDIITIRGSRPPCNPGNNGTGCWPAMRKFASDYGVKILYSVGRQVWHFGGGG